MQRRKKIECGEIFRHNLKPSEKITENSEGQNEKEVKNQNFIAL